jgi:general secretion pathway protein F
MPAYKYEALDAAGQAVDGLVEADNPKAARSQLRMQGLVPLEISAAVQLAGADTRLRLGPKAFSTAELTVWTRQLAGLVGSGLPLERTLTALADEAEAPRQRQLIAHLKSEVNAGSSFARALATAPREFDEVYCAVVAAGEQSGALGKVLESLADDLEEQQALKAKLIGAALYPAIVSLIAVVIVIFLVTYVVPQVAGVFTNSKRALPLLTTLMLQISAFVRQWGWLAALLTGTGAALLALALRQEAFRLRFDAGVLRVPILGRLAKGYNAAPACPS